MHHICAFPGFFLCCRFHYLSVKFYWIAVYWPACRFLVFLSRLPTFTCRNDALNCSSLFCTVKLSIQSLIMSECDYKVWSIWAKFKSMAMSDISGHYSMPDCCNMAVTKPEFGSLGLPDKDTLRLIYMVPMVAPTWPYMAMSEICNFGDDLLTATSQRLRNVNVITNFKLNLCSNAHSPMHHPSLEYPALSIIAHD
jgi:hypothetical protein